MPSLGRWIGIWPSQIFRRLLLSQAELGLATNTLLICSGGKPACRQNCFAGFAEINWADVACSCGYFDQSHFVHDFNKFSGLNPSAYLARCLEGEPNFVRAT